MHIMPARTYIQFSAFNLTIQTVTSKISPAVKSLYIFTTKMINTFLLWILIINVDIAAKMGDSHFYIQAFIFNSNENYN